MEFYAGFSSFYLWSGAVLRLGEPLSIREIPDTALKFSSINIFIEIILWYTINIVLLENHMEEIFF
jgi:hypothetical protein